MFSKISKLAAAAALLPVMAVPASAQTYASISSWYNWLSGGGSHGGGNHSGGGGGGSSSVPEIDASTGLLAMAAVAAGLALAWELKRRRQQA